MPLLSVENVAPGVRLGLWEMSETLGNIFEQYPFLLSGKDELFKSYKSESRRLEVLAVRLILREMFGGDVDLRHDAYGRPYLPGGWHVGISHTKGLAAVMVSRRCRVSVDVEFVSDRVRRIASHFMRGDEVAETTVSLLLHWCTKETMYKLYPEDMLPLKEIRLHAVRGNGSAGTIVAENLRRCEAVEVSFRVSGGFVITYAVLSGI